MQAQQLSARMVQQGLISDAGARSSLEQARSTQISFISLLIRQQTVDTRQLAGIVAEAFSCPLLDIETLNIETLKLWNSDDSLTIEAAGARYSVERLLRRRMLPLALSGPMLESGSTLKPGTGQTLQIAMADPGCIAGCGDDELLKNFLLQPLIVDAQQLDKVLKKLLYQHLPGEAESDNLTLVSSLILPDDAHTDEEPEAASDTAGESADEAPVVKYVNQILLDAVRRRASDIHIEPFESWCRIRYRIDGVLRESARAPAKFSARLSSRVKVMAALDITERRRPQDGRIRLHLADSRAIDLRVSCLPTLWGEKIVLRIMDSHTGLKTLTQLGCMPQQENLYRQALDRHQGMILVTGPTGSGKTMTLYSGLAYLNAGDRNIATAEDPIEINLEGINQVAVNRRSGLDFAAALRAFLRQDPDVVMLGEIRDQETADIAVKAAQTGHLVLSTLHTNSAADTVARLINMGIAGYNLAGALSLVISQRLLRRLCSHCKQATAFSATSLSAEEQKAWLRIKPPSEIFIAAGCRHCQDGYRGRLAVMEMLPVTAEISALIAGNCSAGEIACSARNNGLPSLYDSAMASVAAGETSLDEIRQLLS